jgi:hypothetical protein
MEDAETLDETYDLLLAAFNALEREVALRDCEHTNVWHNWPSPTGKCTFCEKEVEMAEWWVAMEGKSHGVCSSGWIYTPVVRGNHDGNRTKIFPSRAMGCS